MSEKKKMGNKIRKLRKDSSLSLAELSQKINKTSSYLSQIERGLAEPSLNALRQIAEALDTPIFYFLVDEKDYNTVVRKEERKKMEIPGSNLDIELISASRNRQIEMIEAKLGVGKETKREKNTYEGEECILVKNGELKIEIGKEKYNLKEGDSIYFLSSLPHKITNIGEEKLVFISAITPPNI
ncbi:MAG: helix-turn-helix domain-containing protein [Bacillota bacterium]